MKVYRIGASIYISLTHIRDKPAVFAKGNESDLQFIGIPSFVTTTL